jgi:hypothetical protein
MIIGSTAIKYWFPGFPREPKDIDIVGDYELVIPTEKRVERLSNPILLEYYKGASRYLPPDLLYTLKISHVFWDLENSSWSKHMWDIQWLKEKNCQFIPELFYKLYEYWNKVHGKNKRSNLDMAADEFFDNAITFPVEHDYLHELLVKHEYFEEDEPTYKKVLKDGADVDVSEEKFNLLTEKQKFNLVVEEVMIMALERYSELYYKAAFNKMLKKFIINHAPLWEAIWIIQNHKKLITEIPFDFISYLKQKIEENDIYRNNRKIKNII